MSQFTAKELRTHYTGVANGTVAMKSESKFSASEQIAYARGQRDARNDLNMAYLLGKNSPLKPAEKEALKSKRDAKNAEFKEKRGNK